MLRRAGLLALAWTAVAAPKCPGAEPLRATRTTFTAHADGEARARIVASCAPCGWGVRGREAAVLRVRLDEGPWQHVVLTRGAERAEYAVTLGPVRAGTAHVVTVEHDRARSARQAGPPEIADVATRVEAGGHAAHDVARYAPWIHLRADALRRFTDVPLLMWAETDALEGGGRRIRYSVVFSNEDGGTPPDRLMATWGRLTDIEFVYGVELDAGGRIVRERFQGKGHRIEPFRGRRHGGHPLLWVVTENNMLAEKGRGTPMVAPDPVGFDLSGVSREAVMDAHPWTYAVSAAEARREGRVSPDATPGSRRVPDPRRFATLEACADTVDATLTFAVATRGPDGALRWHESDGGEPEFRIARSADHFPNGCFRGAVALPEGTPDRDVAALRVSAHTRVPRKGEPEIPAGRARARLRRVNRLFRLDASDQPGADLFRWTGDLPLAVDGAPSELAIGGGR